MKNKIKTSLVIILILSISTPATAQSIVVKDDNIDVAEYDEDIYGESLIIEYADEAIDHIEPDMNCDGDMPEEAFSSNEHALVDCKEENALFLQEKLAGFEKLLLEENIDAYAKIENYSDFDTLTMGIDDNASKLANYIKSKGTYRDGVYMLVEKLKGLYAYYPISLGLSYDPAKEMITYMYIEKNEIDINVFESNQIAYGYSLIGEPINVVMYRYENDKGQEVVYTAEYDAKKYTPLKKYEFSVYSRNCDKDCIANSNTVLRRAHRSWHEYLYEKVSLKLSDVGFNSYVYGDEVGEKTKENYKALKELLLTKKNSEIVLSSTGFVPPLNGRISYNNGADTICFSTTVEDLGISFVVNVNDCLIQYINFWDYGAFGTDGQSWVKIDPSTYSGKQYLSFYKDDGKKCYYDDTKMNKNIRVVLKQLQNNVYYMTRYTLSDLGLPLYTEEVEHLKTESITFDRTVLTLKPNDTYKITYKKYPDYATEPIVWDSSNERVATVNKGTITALTEGKTVITAKSGEAIKRCEVTVSKYLDPVIKQGNNEYYITLVKGGNVVIPELSDYKFYNNSPQKIVKFSKGKVMAKGVGSTRIYVERSNNTVFLNVTITNPSFAKKTFAINTKESVSVNMIDTELKPYYISSKPNIAKIDSDGNVTALAAGSTKITATIQGKKYTTKVTVYNPTIVGKDMVSVGKALKLKIKNGVKNTKWSVSDTNKATIDSKGKLLAKTKGKVIVYAENNGRIVNKTITIY